MKDKFTQALPSIIYEKTIGHLHGTSIAMDYTICLVEFMEAEDVTVLPKTTRI
jgi:hypothetical protein